MSNKIFTMQPDLKNVLKISRSKFFHLGDIVMKPSDGTMTKRWNLTVSTVISMSVYQNKYSRLLTVSQAQQQLAYHKHTEYESSG